MNGIIDIDIPNQTSTKIETTESDHISKFKYINKLDTSTKIETTESDHTSKYRYINKLDTIPKIIGFTPSSTKYKSPTEYNPSLVNHTINPDVYVQLCSAVLLEPSIIKVIDANIIAASTEGLNAYVKLCIRAIRQSASLLKYINQQIISDYPEEYIKLCKIAIRNKSDAIKHVLYKSDEIVEYALKKNAKVLKYIDDPTEIQCKIALKQNGKALKYVKNKTEELCKIALEQNGMALKYVEDKTDELCRIALSNNGLALKYIENPSHDICILAITDNNYSIKYIKHPSIEMCNTALMKPGRFKMKNIQKENIQEFRLANCQTDPKKLEKDWSDLCVNIIMNHPRYIKYMHDQNEKLCIIALSVYPHYLKYIKYQTYEMCLLAVTNNPRTLRHVDNNLPIDQYTSICMAAMMKEPAMLRFVNNIDTNEYITLCKFSLQMNGCNFIHVKKDSLNEQDFFYLLYFTIYQSPCFEIDDDIYRWGARLHYIKKKLKLTQNDVDLINSFGQNGARTKRALG